ncbi:MAG TPA: Holliday junction resolvase RuvX [Rubrobacteraceae bacterium]|nr:Holliday junction resolvase RuvX [Rubrobacteraceae bacterium]
MAALDLGEARTGVAVSDPGARIARPLEVIPSEDLDAVLERLVREQGVSEVVVGVPKTLGGEVGFQARRVLDRLVALRETFPGVRFVEWDERFTTRLAATGTAGKKRRGNKKGKTRLDHVAAARMLQEYLGTRGNL